MKKEIDPKIQSAATSYAAQFSDGTTLTHFVAFYLGGGDEQAKKNPAVWAPSGGLRGICVPYTQGAHICQQEINVRHAKSEWRSRACGGRPLLLRLIRRAFQPSPWWPWRVIEASAPWPSC